MHELGARDLGDESDARELPDQMYPRRRSEGAGFDLCRWGARGDCDELVKDGGNYCPVHRAAAGSAAERLAADAADGVPSGT